MNCLADTLQIIISNSDISHFLSYRVPFLLIYLRIAHDQETHISCKYKMWEPSLDITNNETINVNLQYLHNPLSHNILWPHRRR